MLNPKFIKIIKNHRDQFYVFVFFIVLIRLRRTYFGVKKKPYKVSKCSFSLQQELKCDIFVRGILNILNVWDKIGYIRQVKISLPFAALHHRQELVSLSI